MWNSTWFYLNYKLKATILVWALINNINITITIKCFIPLGFLLMDNGIEQKTTAK